MKYNCCILNDDTKSRKVKKVCPSLQNLSVTKCYVLLLSFPIIFLNDI